MDILVFARGRADKIGPRMRRLLASSYSGTVVAGAIGLVAGLLLLGGLVFDLGWVGAWKLIGFPGALPIFYDLHSVTASAASCAPTANHYPFIDAECKPWGRFNYPPVWLLLGKIGINESHTAFLATLIELPALTLFVVILRGRSIRVGLLSLLLIFSPSTILAFERGNTDILEWTLICAAALTFSEHRRWLNAGPLILLAFGVVLKFISLFCVTLLVRLKPRATLITALLAVFSLAYFYSLTDVLPIIRRTTPMSPYISYGYLVIFDRLEFLYAPLLGLTMTGLSKSPVPAIAVAIVIAAAITAAALRLRWQYTSGRLSDDAVGTNFLFGSGVYCGTFLLGTNFTYRLIFLLLCLPQILDWIEPKGPLEKGSRRLGSMLFVCSVISMWLKFHPERTLHINQLTDWTLFGVLMMLLAQNCLENFSKLAPRLIPAWLRA